uniref:Uncharacterized protein n=1 Tax=Brassica campestris TaxID=3711 RepID=M4FAJ1_BRACM
MFEYKSSPHPEECFPFRSQSKMLALANASSQLPDIIGEITVVKSSVSDLPADKNHLMATTKLGKYRVELGIADDTAESVFVCFDGVMTKLHNLKADEAGHMLERHSPSKSDLLHTTSQQVIRLTPSHGFLTDVNVRAPLPEFVDNGDDTPGDGTVHAKVETGGSVSRHDQMLEQPLMVEIH